MIYLKILMILLNFKMIFSKFFVNENKLYFNNKEYNIKGINWFGIETVCNVPHGLWVHNTEYYFDLLKKLKFNSIRIPFSYEVASNLDANLNYYCILSDSYIQNLTVRNYIHHLFYHAKIRGMSILLDFHTDHGLIQPYPTSQITQYEGFEAWKNIMSEYSGYENLIGIDIKNEPHGGINWKDWSKYVLDFIQFINKNFPKYNGLFWVQGIEDPNDFSAWGGSFSSMGTSFGLNPSTKIVFSPHVYGVSVRGIDSLKDNENQWNTWFGFLNKYYNNLICIGEIGGWNAGDDYIWHQNVLKYLTSQNIRNFYYWSLNPDSSDTGGILGADWSTLDQSKIDFCNALQPNPTFIDFS